MKKNTFCMIGISVSAVIVLCGILTVAGLFGGRTELAGSAPIYYDSGYASFGGDFYTFVSNNAAEAAQASRTVAKNLDRIAKLLKNVLGTGLIGLGLLSGCYFCMKKNALAEEKQASFSTVTPQEPYQKSPEAEEYVSAPSAEAGTGKPDEGVPEPKKEESAIVSDELPPL